MNQFFHYDHVYPYTKILNEIKELIIPTIIEKINLEDIKTTGLNKQALTDFIYTQIMALGYNDGDINASLNDLMPNRSPIFYNDTEEIDAIKMAVRLSVISEEYSYQISAFSTFHQMTLALKPHKEVIKTVKIKLLHC